MTVDKSQERIRRMFGEVAPRYDLLNHLLSGGADYLWRRKTVRVAKPDGREPILDVCTGTGDLALSYWKRGRGRVPVVGTDFTHEMLRLANRKRPRSCRRGNGAGKLTFLEADTVRLPFDDDQFQIVSVAFGLRNVTDTEAGLREMIRVCRPGGRVVVLEFSMPSNPLIARLYRWYFENVLPRIGQLISRNRQTAYDYLPESVSQFPHGSDLADLMQRCGLCPVTWKALTFGIATLYCGRKPETKS